MTAKELFQRLLRAVDMEFPGVTPSYIQDDIAIAVNQAYQVLYLDVPREYRCHYTRDFTTVNLLAGQGSYSLAGTQGLLSPVYYASDSKVLAGTANKYEILNYHNLIGNACATQIDARPQVYYLERSASVLDDSTTLTLYVAPTPIAAEVLNLEVERMAPSFTAADFCATTPPPLRMPHDYIESLLLPVATYMVARSAWFDNEEKIEMYREDYQRTLIRAGASDPQNLAADATHESNDA